MEEDSCQDDCDCRFLCGGPERSLGPLDAQTVLQASRFQCQAGQALLQEEELIRQRLVGLTLVAAERLLDSKVFTNRGARITYIRVASVDGIPTTPLSQSSQSSSRVNVDIFNGVIVWLCVY